MKYLKKFNEGRITATDVDGKKWTISQEEANKLRKWCEETRGWDMSDQSDEEMLEIIIDDAGDYEDEYPNLFIQFREDIKLGDKLKTPIKTKDKVILTHKKDPVYLYDKETKTRRDTIAHELHYPVINGKTWLAYKTKNPPYIVFSSPEARQKEYPNAISVDSLYNNLIRQNDMGKRKELINKLDKQKTPLGDKLSGILKKQYQETYPDFSKLSPSQLQKALDSALDDGDELLAHEISKFLK